MVGKFGRRNGILGYGAGSCNRWGTVLKATPLLTNPALSSRDRFKVTSYSIAIGLGDQSRDNTSIVYVRCFNAFSHLNAAITARPFTNSIPDLILPPEACDQTRNERKQYSKET
jgi:hypothetical protein